MKKSVGKIFILLLVVFLIPFVFGANQLIAYYPLDGNANDVSGFGNNGIVNGATFVSGKIGQAASFDGKSYVTLPAANKIFDLKANFTISAWVYPLLDDSGGILKRGIHSYKEENQQYGIIHKNSDIEFDIGDGMILLRQAPAAIHFQLINGIILPVC